MTRATLILSSDAKRAQAQRWCAIAPDGSQVEFRAPKRSLPQNARMWAMLSTIASQVEWHGVKLSAEDWKLIFMDALKREFRMAPNLSGQGFVNLGASTSRLSKEEMSDLMVLIEQFAAQRGVDLGDMND